MNSIDSHISGYDTLAMALAISNDLNDLWDEAWNVFVCSLFNSERDAVVYGYAFRDHWLWINNKIKPGG